MRRGSIHHEQSESKNPAPANERQLQIPALSNLSTLLGAGDWTLTVPRLHRCEPAWHWRPPPLPDWDFWLVLAGRGSVRLGKREIPLNPGRWFLFQPGDQPEGAHDPAFPLEVFACHFRRADNHRLSPEVLTGRFADAPRWDAETAVRVAAESPAGRALATALLRSIVLQALYEAGRNPVPGRDRLDALALEIRAAPGRSWPASALARRCGMSAPHFHRLWRAAHGCSPGRFVILHRVRRATHLLRESDLSLQQIADALGYAELTFFHRQFRRFTGATPRAVRLGAPSKLDDSPEKL